MYLTLYFATGNCIWYDEPKYMNDISSLLKKNKVPISTVQWPDLKVPDEISSFVESGGYGEQVKGGCALNPEVKNKMQKIESQVKQLALTESSLQTDYWNLRHKFTSVASKQ